jgi:hypothetical protein
MSSIDPASRVLAYLREQAQGLRREAAGNAVQRTGRQPASSAPAAPERLAVAIAGIDRTSADAGRKAFRCFLEATLLRELGDAMANDPGFGAIVDRVLATMEADASIQPAMVEAGLQLLATYGKP